jgi:flavin-dependent thymidylate synthase
MSGGTGVNGPRVGRLSSQHELAVIEAARVCQDSFWRQSPEQDSRLIARLRSENHLTCFEHATYLAGFKTDTEEGYTRCLTALLEMPRPPRFRALGDGNFLLGFNLSHVRYLCTHGSERARPLAARLYALVAPHAPLAVVDLDPGPPGPRVQGYPWPEHHLAVHHPDLLAVFPVRRFLIRCSRVALAQITRHRTISWEVRSQRAVDESGANLIWPPRWTKAVRGEVEELRVPGDIEVALHATAEGFHSYGVLREQHGWSRQDARYVLPQAVETQAVATGDMAAWRHFLTERGFAGAQAEARYIAWQIYRYLEADNPAFVAGITVDEAGIKAWTQATEVTVAAD